MPRMSYPSQKKSPCLQLASCSEVLRCKFVRSSQETDRRNRGKDKPRYPGSDLNKQHKCVVWLFMANLDKRTSI